MFKSSFLISVKKKIVQAFGCKEPLVKLQRGYKFRCVYNHCRFHGKELKRHLVLKHLWQPDRAKKEVSVRLKMFRYLNHHSFKGVYKPRVSHSYKHFKLLNLIC